MIDKIYKVGLLVLGTIFLILFYINAQTNRCQLKLDRDDIVILDTNSGRIYLPPSKDNKKWTVADPVHGDVNEIPITRRQQ